MEKWELYAPSVMYVCEYLHGMNFFSFSQINADCFLADFMRDHLQEYYAALQLRIMLLYFFYKYCRCYAAQSVNLPFKIFSH